MEKKKVAKKTNTTPKKKTIKKVTTKNKVTKSKKNRKKAFTLIELLAVIIILGILMVVAIPAVTSYIQNSRKSSYVATAHNVVAGARTKVNDGTLSIHDSDTTYYLPYRMVKGEKEVKSPYGDFEEAYVVVTFDGNGYDYYWTSRDTTNTGIYLTYNDLLDNDKIANDMTVIDTNIGVGNRSNIVVYNTDGSIKETKNKQSSISEKGSSSGGGSQSASEPSSFATDSWATIANAVRNNNTSAYHVGDTKEVDLGSLGTHSVRISNMSTPSSCSTTGYSQTACGFVLEFVDVILEQRMNPYEQSASVNGDGNKGGWEYSEARQYLNSTVYNALPSDLKSVIIDTFAVSGPGSSDSTNFLTTDKLYLLSKTEIDGDTNLYGNGNNYDNTFSRGLDYYAGYTTDNSIAIKNYNGSPRLWCLRTAVRGTGLAGYRAFWAINNTNGFTLQSNACSGMSPAFRIG